jgi:hypothetical protein
MQTSRRTNEYAHLPLEELKKLNRQIHRYMKKSKKKRRNHHLERVYNENKLRIHSLSIFESTYKDRLSFLNDIDIKANKVDAPSLDFLCDKQPVISHAKQSIIDQSIVLDSQMENARNYLLVKALMDMNKSLSNIIDILSNNIRP